MARPTTGPTLALDTAASGRPVPAMVLWHEALDGLAGSLVDVEVTLLPADSRDAQELPLIAAPTSPTIDRAPVQLPRQGAVVTFRDPRLHEVLLLRPHARRRDPQVDRRLVFTLRDHVEALLLADTGA